jgi:hypothetical protein
MITALKSPNISVLADSGTNKLHQVVDLVDVQNAGDIVVVEVALKTNGVAPGADKTVTVNAAFCSLSSATPTELSTNVAEQVCALEDAADTRRFYMLPLLWQGARFLHIWFDADARDAGSAIEITTYINTKR